MEERGCTALLWMRGDLQMLMLQLPLHCYNCCNCCNNCWTGLCTSYKVVDVS